jgi:dCTP deaminase
MRNIVGTDMPSRNELLRRLSLKDGNPEKLVVTPLVNDEVQIVDGSIDLRLSTEFVLTKRSKFPTLNPLQDREHIESKILEYQERMFIDIGREFILHPHQFALGATFEYVKMPVDLVGYVIGRSSWGRLGLIIATATMVHPNYAGIITLELTNLGDTPITLYPGTRVAQLAFHTIGLTEKQKSESLKKAQEKEDKYKASVSPGFTKIHKDIEWNMIDRLRKGNKPRRQEKSQ